MGERGNTEYGALQESGRPASVNVRQLTEAVITALTEWNATALELLSQQASSWIEEPPSPHLLAASVDQYRLLGVLLQETDRNLRIFKETSPCTEFQPGTGSYKSRWA
jgi:hypothetical protein